MAGKCGKGWESVGKCGKVSASVVSLKFDNSSMLALAELSIQSPGGSICGVLTIQQVHPTVPLLVSCHSSISR
jgi:hypothetical protein